MILIIQYFIQTQYCAFLLHYIKLSKHWMHFNYHNTNFYRLPYRSLRKFYLLTQSVIFSIPQWMLLKIMNLVSDHKYGGWIKTMQCRYSGYGKRLSIYRQNTRYDFGSKIVISSEVDYVKIKQVMLPGLVLNIVDR